MTGLPSFPHYPPWLKPWLSGLPPKGEQLEGILRIGGAEDEHGAMGHHGFATLTLLLLLFLHFLLLFFDLCLLQGTGFSISLVTNCKRDVLKSSETWLHAWCPLFSVGFGMERLGKHLRDAPRKPLCEHWGFSFFFLFLILH